MFHQWGSRIDRPLEAYLLATFEEEPFPYQWNEQDLYDQIRKLLCQHEQGTLDVSVPPKEERQRLRYESLKDSYLELLGEVTQLRELIINVKELLGENTHY